MHLRTCILILLSLVNVGCVARYQGPPAGPIAHLKFDDNLGLTLRGTRKTGVVYYEDATCNSPVGLSADDRIAVPANKTIGIHHFWSTVGMIQSYCGVWTSLELSEGQEVQITYRHSSAGARQYCELEAHEVDTAGKASARIALKPWKGKTCIH